MSENGCEFPYPSYEIRPYKIFISHSSKDKDICEVLDNILNDDISTYVAERKAIGIPLTQKLRDELVDSDAILVLCTKNAKDKKNLPDHCI